jgi:Rieske Fe-S protein
MMEQDLLKRYIHEKQQGVSRRHVLAIMGTGSIAVASLLSGCSPFGGSDTTASQSPTSAQSSTPVQVPAQAPTQAPTSSTSQSGVTGTAIGQKSMASNSAKTFTDPANQQGAVLVHLSDGSFVAYDSSCTHQGVTVNYDPATKMLVCPLHNSIFDPANGAKVLAGPAPSPLPKVAISVNSDGTITAGQ